MTASGTTTTPLTSGGDAIGSVLDAMKAKQDSQMAAAEAAKGATLDALVRERTILEERQKIEKLKSSQSGEPH